MTLLEKANQATLREAAEICGCHYARLFDAVRVGALPARLRRFKSKQWRYVVDLSDVEAYLAITNGRGRFSETLALLKQGQRPEVIASRLGVQYHSVLRMKQRAIARGELRAA